MRVVHIITRLIVGGAQENTLYNVIDLQEEHGDEVTLVTGPAEGPEGDLFSQASAYQLDISLVPQLRRAVDPRADFAAYRGLVREIRRRKPEVVHTHSSKAGILGRLAAKRCNVPAIVHTIHGLPFHPYERWYRNWSYILAERYCARLTDRILSVANAMTEQALAAKIGRPEQYRTVYSGMAVESFLDAGKKRMEVRQSLGYRPQEIVIGKVARLFELKGHDDIIDAARVVVAAVPTVRFLFVGGGVWRERLQARAQREGLAEHFRFLGLVPPDRIPELLAAMDIVVHASYREGLARVLPQALITGTPVISYDVDGAREVVIPGVTGYLVAPSDIKALGEAMIRLSQNPAERTAMGAEGRRRFTDLFRHQRMTQQIREIYEEILHSKRASRGREVELAG